MVIFNGKYFSMDESLEIFGGEELARVKTDIIRQKMDNLFHYENEEVALKKFKENMEEKNNELTKKSELNTKNVLITEDPKVVQKMEHEHK